MPGNIGMVPLYISFSVPMEMPEKSIDTTTSSACGGVSVRKRNATRSGSSTTTANVSIQPNPSWEPVSLAPLICPDTPAIIQSVMRL